MSTATAIAPLNAKPKASLIAAMAAKHDLEPAMFQSVIRKTCFNKECTNEEFAAFLMVCQEYDLNPVVKQIYAFPGKNGGIQPIVSVDGWATIINRQPQLDGITFTDNIGQDGKLVSITCELHRKDRSMPVVVTEYMSECVRNTEPWKQWPARMLRHKALIQCARYAFGLSGLQDEDEYMRQFDRTRGSDALEVQSVRVLEAALTPTPEGKLKKIDPEKVEAYHEELMAEQAAKTPATQLIIDAMKSAITRAKTTAGVQKVFEDAKAYAMGDDQLIDLDAFAGAKIDKLNEGKQQQQEIV